MGTPSTRPDGSRNGETETTVFVGLLVVIIALAVVAGSVTAAIGGVGPTGTSTDGGFADTHDTDAVENETTENETQAVDVVLVFDRSESMDASRYEIAKEMEDFDERLDTEGKDVRYALITYASDSDVRQPLTDDYDAFHEALNFGTAESRENASDALLASTDQFREDSERVVIIVTNEDDDSSAAQRAAATEAMSGVDFLAVSPDDPIDSSCEFHTPPCDTDSDNELRTMAADVGGDWVDVESDSSTIVTEMATTVGADDSGTSTGGSSTGSSYTAYSTSSPDIEPVNGSVNLSTVEIGEEFEVSITLENDGSADGTADEDLQTEDESIASLDVEVPEDETVTATVNHSFDTPGTYDLFYDHMHVATVEVTPLRDTGVSLAAPSETRLEATVTDARENETVRIPVTHPDVYDSAFGPMTAVWVTTTQDADYTVAVEANSKSGTVTGPFTDHVRPIAYPGVSTTLAESEIEAIGIEYADGDDRIEFYGQSNDTSWTAYEGIAIDTAAAGATTTNGTFDETSNESGTGVRYEVLSITTEEVDSSENESLTDDETAITNETTTDDGTTQNETTETQNQTTQSGNETVNETSTIQTTTMIDSVEIASNESATGVTLAWDQETDRYVASVPANGTFAFGLQQPGFAVETLALDSDSVVTGEQVVATIVIGNDGQVPGTYEAILRADGDPVAETTVYVPANDSREVSLSFTPDSSGEYTLDVGGSTEATLVVEDVTESPSVTTTTEDPETETASPGFTVIGFLVAALVVGIFVMRRYR